MNCLQRLASLAFREVLMVMIQRLVAGKGRFPYPFGVAGIVAYPIDLYECIFHISEFGRRQGRAAGAGD